MAPWFPPEHSQDRFERDLRTEALAAGLSVLCRLLCVPSLCSLPWVR